MRGLLFSRYSRPLVAFGALVAGVCLTGSWYINRLQADLARAIREDAAGMQAAVDLQVQLRNLRVHSLVLVANRTDARKEVVRADLSRVDTALKAVKGTAVTPEDSQLAAGIAKDYSRYADNLPIDSLPSQATSLSDLSRWSDEHHMEDLLVLCRELADRQGARMRDSLERSETQSAWAGGVLLGLGVAGVLAGLLSGYATARALTRRVAHLFVRVQAVQAHLDQEVGAMTVEAPSHVGDLDEQLDRMVEQVVQRVSNVCQRLQEQERNLLRAEQLAAVGQLAAGVAHEVRNPLTGIKCWLQMAVRPQNPLALTVDRLQLLLQEVARIERTVQGLMDFAQAPILGRRPNDMRRVIEAAVNVAQSRAEARSVVIRFTAPATAICALVNRDHMISLLTNLLFNAIEAVPTGGEVRIAAIASAGGMLRVIVTDNGPGIDRKIAEKLFTPFVTTKANGTGLGLSIARRIATEHGGTLTASDGLDGGACFTLTLPTVEEAHDQALGC